jgi:hypothetical protein
MEIIPQLLHTFKAGQDIPKALGLIRDRQRIPKKG